MNGKQVTPGKSLAELFVSKLGDLNQSDLAREIGCNASTLRTWFDRSKFPRDVAVMIAKFLKLPESELDRFGSDQFTKPTGRKSPARETQVSFPDAVELLDQICSRNYSRRPPQVEKQISSAVLGIVGAMGAGCYWITTTQSKWPLVLDPHGPDKLAASLFAAIDRGMLVGLVIPTEASLTAIVSRYKLHDIITHARFVEGFRKFKKGYIEHRGGSGSAEAAMLADERIQLFESPDFLISPFGTAATVLGASLAVGNPATRVLLETPIDKGSGLLLAAQNSSYEDTARAFTKVVIGEATADGEWHARAPKGVTQADANAAIFHRKQFIRLFSRYRRGDSTTAPLPSGS